MDFSSFIQPPGNPIEWAALNQRTRDGAVEVASDARHMRQQQAQFDVNAEQNQQQLDESHRSNVAGEAYNQDVLAHNKAKFEQEKANEIQRRREEYSKNKREIYANSETKEDVNAAMRALNEAYGFVQVPGPRPQPAMSAPGAPVMDPMAPAGSVDESYSQALGSLDSFEQTPIKDSADPEYSQRSLTEAQAADLGPLATTADGNRPPPITAPVPETDEDFRTLELELSKPIVDLGDAVKAQDEAEAAERFLETSDKIRAFRLTDPAVEGAALNMLADATGQPRVAPTMPVPHPMAPPEAQITPEGMIPPEILALINDARADQDDVASGLVLNDGKYHTVDSQTGEIIDEGDLWEETRNARIEGRLARANMVFADLPEGSQDRKVFESHAKAYANARTDDEAKQHLAILMQRLQDSAAEKRARIMAQQRDTTSNRLEEGAERDKLDWEAKRVDSIAKELVGNVDFKKRAKEDLSVRQQLESLRANPGSMEQRFALKEMIVRAEGGRATDADAKAAMVAGLGIKFDEWLNSLTDGELSPERLKQMETILSRREQHNAEYMADVAEDLNDAIVTDKALRKAFAMAGMSEEDIDEELQSYADSKVAAMLPGVKNTRVKRGKVPAKPKAGRKESSSTSSTRTKTAEEIEAELGMVE